MQHKNTLKTLLRKLIEQFPYMLIFVVVVVNVPEIVALRKILRQNSIKLTTVIILCIKYDKPVSYLFLPLNNLIFLIIPF